MLKKQPCRQKQKLRRASVKSFGKTKKCVNFTKFLLLVVKVMVFFFRSLIRKNRKL